MVEKCDGRGIMLNARALGAAKTAAHKLYHSYNRVKINQRCFFSVFRMSAYTPTIKLIFKTMGAKTFTQKVRKKQCTMFWIDYKDAGIIARKAYIEQQTKVGS
jgi:hypothetical protein